VEVVGEEFDQGVPTRASLECPNWHPIDMPPEERQHRNIPSDYTDCANYTEQQKTGWNLERERYMAEEFRRHIGAATSALIICGAEHIQGLENLLVGAGHEVTGRDDVTKAVWFEPPL
jgi:hypothetical protein